MMRSPLVTSFLALWVWKVKKELLRITNLAVSNYALASLAVAGEKKPISNKNEKKVHVDLKKKGKTQPSHLCGNIFNVRK